MRITKAKIKQYTKPEKENMLDQNSRKQKKHN